MRSLATIAAPHGRRWRPNARRLLGVAESIHGPHRNGADPLLTAGEVAALLQVTQAWVYAQARAKRIPHVPLGRYVRFRRSAVMAWLDDLERQPCGGVPSSGRERA